MEDNSKEITATHDESGIAFSNEREKIVVIPTMGGRVMFYGLNGGLNLLYEDENETAKAGNYDGTWRNYGGYKSWLSPQDSWPTNWPPDPAWDTAPFQVRSGQTEHGWEMDLTGPTDRQNLAQVRRFVMDKTGLTVEQGFANYSSDTVEWASWNVTQVPVPGTVFLPKGEVHHVTHFEAQGQIEDKGGWLECGLGGPGEFKFGLRGAVNWLAYRSEAAPDVVFVQSFEHNAQARYPDGHVIEIYNHIWAEYAELEIVFPLTELEPQAICRYPMRWQILDEAGWQTFLQKKYLENYGKES